MWVPKSILVGLVTVWAALLTAPVEAVPESLSNQSTNTQSVERPVTPNPSSSKAYILGPDDQITIQALEVEEISSKPLRIDTSGYINMPLVGRIKAAGMTVQQLETEMIDRLKTYIREPQVAISVAEFRSQPVSVIGYVGSPGVHQVEGRKTLLEILSQAGGVKPDAGHSVKITRRKEAGPIPLPECKEDPTGQFTVAEVNLKGLMEARNPEENILIMPHDVISVPKAQIVYVVGDVKKSGSILLGEKRTVSVLEAVSIAEGLQPTAKANKARVMRLSSLGQNDRVEIPVNVARILSGKETDFMLQPDDILFIPSSTTKAAVSKSLEAAVSAAIGTILWRGF